MSLKVLQEALDKFQTEYNNYLDLTEKVLPGQPKIVREFVLSMLESLTLYNLSINRIKNEFAEFRKGFDETSSQETDTNFVVIDRKQLSEERNKLSKEIGDYISEPLPKQFEYWKHHQLGRYSLIKELLAGSGSDLK